MTLLETKSSISNTDKLLAIIDHFRAKPVPYEFEKGKIPRIALDQGVFWRDKTGKLYEIEEMSSIHAQRALTKLYFAFGKEKNFNTKPLFNALLLQARSGK